MCALYPCNSNWVNVSVALQGHIYAAGGLNAGSNGPTERYDPATNTWTRLGDLGFQNYDAAVAVLNGQVWTLWQYADTQVLSHRDAVLKWRYRTELRL